MNTILGIIAAIFGFIGFLFVYVLCKDIGDLTTHDRQFFLIIVLLSFIGSVISAGLSLIAEAINDQTEYLKSEDVVNEIGTP